MLYPFLKEYSTDDLESLIKSANDELTNRTKSLNVGGSLNSVRSVCTLPPQQYEVACGKNGYGESPCLQELTKDQEVAWDKIQRWLATEEPIFLLKGYAGTGKSFLMKKLLGLKKNFVFSAPTNKASSVLSSFIGMPVRTTYSVLGLRMTAEDDQLVLTQSEDLPNLGNNPILVIDESSMVPKFMVKLLTSACSSFGWRVIFVGDPAQHTPVGETRSPCWKTVGDSQYKTMLREVRRFDNELLKLSVHLRECVIDTSKRVRIRPDSNRTAGEGVFLLSEYEWIKEVKSNRLEDWTRFKIVAWRNKTCNHYNSIVRKALGFKLPYEVGEVLLLAAPMFLDGQIIAHTDDEVVIRNIEEQRFSFPEQDLDAYVFTVDKPFLLYVPKSDSDFQKLLSKRASIASSLTGSQRKAAWANFWEVKQKFTPVRYGYALTSHRLQGSTVEGVYADQRDLLANSHKRSSARAMYVTGTRATKFFKTF